MSERSQGKPKCSETKPVSVPLYITTRTWGAIVTNWDLHGEKLATSLLSCDTAAGLFSCTVTHVLYSFERLLKMLVSQILKEVDLPS